MIRLKRTTSNDPDLKGLIIKLDKALFDIYNEEQELYAGYDKMPDIDTVIIAYEDAIAVGCGSFKIFDDNTVEIKRMFVDNDKRSKGIAAVILKELEAWAKELNYSFAVLETGNLQKAAMRLYQKQGYTITENYLQYINMPNSFCMKKQLQ